MSLIDVVHTSFNCEISRTERVNKVFDAFGLDIDNYSHVVVDNIQVPNNWDVIYITGISGSGKSTLLRSLAERYSFDISQYGMSAMYSQLASDERPLIDCIGSTFEQAISFLNSVGLSEAFIYFKKFVQLSEGQRYRFYLAKLLELTNTVIVVDEFTSLLDRITANIVAYNYTKAMRRYRKKLIVATSHDDLTKSLNPSHRITFSYSGEHTIERLRRDDSIPPYIGDIVIAENGKSPDTTLLKYHYKNTKMPAMVTNTFTALLNNYPVGMIVYSVPMRTYMLGSFLMSRRDRRRYDKLSTDEKRLLSGNNTLIVSRVVIHPTFRGIGLGAYLLRETLSMVDKKVIVLSSVMSNYVAFCEAAGMTQIQPKSSSKFKRLTKFYEKYDIDVDRVHHDMMYAKKVAKRLRSKRDSHAELLTLIEQYLKQIVTPDVTHLERYLVKLRPIDAKTYVWVNEDVPLNFNSIDKFRGKLIHKKRRV